MKKLIAEYEDEWYGYVYKCPNCGENRIWNDFAFCPYCGISLKDYIFE